MDVAGNRSRTDPRVVASRQRILATTLDLLVETGLGGLTVDEVARRSGVAKTTIYRHWSNRTDLIIAACSLMTDGDQEPPDAGSLEGDVTAVLSELAEVLATARWATILPSIVDAAERDSAIAARSCGVAAVACCATSGGPRASGGPGRSPARYRPGRVGRGVTRTAVFPALVLARTAGRPVRSLRCPDGARRPANRRSPPVRCTVGAGAGFDRFRTCGVVDAEWF